MSTLIPVEKFKAWSIRHNRWEIWEAIALDGGFHFVRDESPGTPWIVTHSAFPGWFGYFGSLTKARKLAERQLHFDLTVGLAAAEMSQP